MIEIELRRSYAGGAPSVSPYRPNLDLGQGIRVSYVSVSSQGRVESPNGGRGEGSQDSES